MTILDIELVHFGKFHNKKIKFSPGLNVVYGKNETGKSTIHAFIHCMLFGIHDNEADEECSAYRLYCPWDDQGGFGGKMRLLIGDHVYRIERSFLKGNCSLKLWDETAGQELDPADIRLKELTEGLNETNFINTISIGQLKSPTEPELIDELESFLNNTSQTKNIRINIIAAQKRLEEKAARLRERYLEDADGEYEECGVRLQTAKDEYGRFTEQEYQQKCRCEELAQEIRMKKRQGEEELLAYDREREEICRSYEAAKNAYEHAPQREPEIKLYRAFFFMILALLFAGGIAYLYFIHGFEQDSAIFAAAGFAAGLFLALAGMGFCLHAYFDRRNDNWQRDRRHDVLKSKYEKSAKEFMECKKNRPVGYDKEIAAMQKEAETLSHTIDECGEQAKRWKLEIENLTARRQEIRSGVIDNRVIAQELEAVELAIETLEQVSCRVQETFGNRLCKEASLLLAEVTGHKYDRIVITEKRKIRIGCADRDYPLTAVSRGTVEQVYFAIRIAAANLLWQKSPMPFIFDDIFAYYDDERLEAAMNLLRGCGHQVIIFSCNTREDKLLGAQGNAG